MTESLTIRDILQRPYFQGSTVYASEKALQRTVEWVHILEVAEVGQLLNGNELILTTGLIWQHNEEMSLSFLQQIMDRNASGLCIEIGRVINSIPDAMRQMAEKADFPLILIDHDIRYIDITRDIHTWIINLQHKKIAELENLSVRFNELILLGTGLQPLLSLFYETARKPIAYLPPEGKPLCAPSLPVHKQQDIIRQKLTLKNRHDPRVGTHPITVMGFEIGELLIWSEDSLDKYDLLALDRCATAVAQELMRTIFWEERRMYRQNQWVHDWLAGKHEEKDMKEYIMSFIPAYKPGQNVVIVFEPEPKTLRSPDFETALIQKNGIARVIFEKEGFFLIPAFMDEQIIYIVLDLQNRQHIQPSLFRAISKLKQTDQQNLPLFSFRTGVGRPFSELSHMKKSLESAQETISIQKAVGPLAMPFYSELHVYRVISSMKNNGQLSDFVADYLDPIIQYDAKKNTQLLHTLKVFLKFSGAKRETAKELYISRQTLYHRLKQIAALLGDDFMSQPKRLALELALYAYEFLYGAIEKTIQPASHDG
jgi:purine catabolism regulator